MIPFCKKYFKLKKVKKKINKSTYKNPVRVGKATGWICNQMKANVLKAIHCAIKSEKVKASSFFSFFHTLQQIYYPKVVLKTL